MRVRLWQPTDLIPLYLLEVLLRCLWPDCDSGGFLQRILKVEYDFPSNLKVSQNCRDLLSKILVDKPEKRITIPEIQKHPWYVEDLPPGVAEMNDNLPSPGPEVQVPPLYTLHTPNYSPDNNKPITAWC